MVDSLKFYAVRSKDGKWLRRKGYGGSGDCWVDELSKARVYNKIGPARGQANWWFKNYKSFGCPDIVVFTVTATEVINDEDRIAKQIKVKEKKAKIAELQLAKRRLEDAENKVKEAQINLKKLVE